MVTALLSVTTSRGKDFHASVNSWGEILLSSGAHLYCKQLKRCFIVTSGICRNWRPQNDDC